MDTGGACSTDKIQWFEKKGRKKGESCSFVARRHDKNNIDMRCAVCVVLFVSCIFEGCGEVVDVWIWERGEMQELAEVGDEERR